MILNSYAVLDICLAFLRLAFTLLILGLGVSAWRKSRRPLAPEGKKGLEDQSYLLFLVALLLLGLNLVSWPLLYLVLQSYVPEWPGVMCIYGVTQIGTGSIGASRFLPRLLQILQVTKPALVFCSGAWFTLYLINRRTQTACLIRRILALLLVLGLLSGGDAAVEMAYLLIPKQEEFPSGGCCTMAFDDPASGVGVMPDAVCGVDDRPGLSSAYFGVNAVLVLGLFGYAGWVRRRQEVPRLAPLLVLALAALPISATFLIEVAAPILLRLPYHHCPYDLIPKVPDAILGVALFCWGTFCVGWAWIASWAGNCPESRPFLPRGVGTMLWMGFFCYLAAVVLMIVELALA